MNRKAEFSNQSCGTVGHQDPSGRVGAHMGSSGGDKMMLSRSLGRFGAQPGLRMLREEAGN